MTKINESIFRTYDIRGIYPDEINEEAAYAIGRSVVRFLKAKKIAIGYDMRIGSPALHRAAIKGAIDEGANVYNIGKVGIELAYFSCGFYKMDAGIMITASHNPKEYCGMKLIREKAIALTSGTGLEEVKKIALGDWAKTKIRRRGRVKKINPWPDYLKYIKKIINPKNFKSLIIVIDAENGMAGTILEKLLDKTPIKLKKLNFKPNGNFPKHDPNPLLSDNRQEIVAAIKKYKADAGFITDGDGDRMVIIDEKGQFVLPVFGGALVAEKLLRERKNKVITWELRNFWALKDIAKKYKAKIYITRAGFPFVKLMMRKKGAIFGGENSSHFFFKDFFTSDSGVLAILHVIEMISAKSKPLSELVKKYRDNYFVIEEQNFETKNSKKIFGEIERKYKKNDAKISYLDGVSVGFSDWHFNIRASNTEPVVRLTLEAKNKKLLEQKTDEVVGLIKKNL